MKITVYTTTECQFSKQEKEYLTSHNLPYEEKNLETNKEFLTEMLAVGNNFAGTPVSKIEKDDGSIVVLKGFTKEEFDQALGFTAAPQTPAPSPQQTPTPPPPPQPTTPTPVEPPKETPPATEPPPGPPPAPPAPPASPANEQLNSILNDLQQKSAEPSPVTAPSSTSSAPNLPSIPDFQAK